MKNANLTNPRQNKINIPNNRPHSTFDTGVSKWTNTIDNQNFPNSSTRQNISVGASGDNSGNPQMNNSENKSSNSYSGSKFFNVSHMVYFIRILLSNSISI